MASSKKEMTIIASPRVDFPQKDDVTAARSLGFTVRNSHCRQMANLNNHKKFLQITHDEKYPDSSYILITRTNLWTTSRPIFRRPQGQSLDDLKTHYSNPGDVVSLGVIYGVVTQGTFQNTLGARNLSVVRTEGSCSELTALLGIFYGDFHLTTLSVRRPTAEASRRTACRLCFPARKDASKRLCDKGDRGRDEAPAKGDSLGADPGPRARSRLTRQSEHVVTTEPSGGFLSTWSDQDHGLGDADHYSGQEASLTDSGVGSGPEISLGSESLVLNPSWCLGQYLRKHRPAHLLPVTSSVYQVRLSVVRDPGRPGTKALEEAAVLHARTVLDLIDDISSAVASEAIIAGDYILQIQFEPQTKSRLYHAVSQPTPEATSAQRPLLPEVVDSTLCPSGPFQRRPGYHRFYNEQLFSRQIQHAVATLKQVQCRPRGRGAGPPQNPPHRPSRTLGPPSRPWPSAAPRACLYRRNATADASGSGGECQPGVLFSWHSLRGAPAPVCADIDGPPLRYPWDPVVTSQQGSFSLWPYWSVVACSLVVPSFPKPSTSLWLQAVEKFSANTQEISASLRAFTQKLQETEFPNDVTSTEELLQSQTSEYNALKDDLLSASRHGETLLNCIKRPGEPRTARLCPDKLINVTAVERLLVQLEETERTFDEFWTRHEGRLTQCLQLRRFETDFRELQQCLEISLKQLSAMSEIGDSVHHVDQLLAEAQDFHMMTADQLEKAEELRIIGTQLIESQHYAVDSIQPKCVELVRMRDAFHDRITNRLETLHKCRDLQERIEQANKWCTEGVELLASQQIERCQAPEFAEEALRELDEFLASSEYSRLGTSRELRTMFEDVITPETKGLVQQVLKRIEDVQMMCEKRKSSLKKLATRLPRPVHAVTPEPAVPLHYPQGHANVHPHSHPASPLHADLPKSPKSMRKASTLPKLGDSGDSPDWVGDAEAARAKRGHVLRELLDTERIYVSELCSILKGYKDEMLNPEMQPLIPINLYGKSDILFGNMEDIFRFHNDVFLRDLENCINTPELIGLCFVQRKDTFHRLYSLYCQNKPQSEELRRQVGDQNPFFKECQRRLHHKLPLGAYLLKPVQRITKYQLLLKDLLKCVEGSQGRRELQEAVDTMLTVLKCLNDSMHQVAITGFPGNLADLGKLLMQGPFSVWNDSKKGLRELRLKPAQRHIFLYEKMLLFTKRTGKDTDRATYHFKNALKMSQVGLTESVRGHKGDVRKFEVWLQGRQEVHTILAPSSEVKDLWVKEIKRVLLDQFEYLKGENIKQYSARIQKGASLNGIRIPPLSPTTQHRALRQTASWDIAGNGVTGSGGSISSSSSEGRPGGEPSREIGKRSLRIKSVDATLGDAPEEEEESWSSDYSASDEEEDQETFSESTEYTSSRFLVLADYNAMGGSEVSLREGDYVDLIKVGCAGWWYVRVSGTPYEGWAPAAYLERVLKKGSRSSPSVSSQESSSGLKHATSKSSVASLSAKSEEVNIM
nr:guanine nucleotide exchange factor DBS-like [Penaeus vannamei]